MSTILLPREQIQLTENRFPDLADDLFTRLKASIAKSKILEPLLVKKENGNYLLIQGHQRLRAATELNMKEIPCIVVENEDAVAAEFDVNLYRRHLTAEELTGYENIKSELETQQEGKLIPELAYLEGALPENLLKFLKSLSVSTQQTFYRSLPQKYVTDPEETKRHEQIVREKEKRIEEQSLSLKTLQTKVDVLEELKKNYEVLQKSKKSDLEKALEIERQKIEQKYACKGANDEEKTALLIEQEKERLAREYEKKLADDTEEYRQIAAEHSRERNELQKQIAPLKDEVERLKKDIKMYQTAEENKKNDEKFAQEKLEKLVKMHKVPDMIKTLTKEMSFLRTRVLVCKEYIVELGDLIHEDRSAILPTLKSYGEEINHLTSAAKDVLEILK